ncbi:MAG: bifunctional hydroxymethylpyrimidine kinase/phosphomethylpyrimidine kinase [Pseudomonadota bacterium]
MRRLPDLSTYLVLDPDLCADIGMVETALLAASGGATVIQLRHKTASTGELVATGQRIKDALKGKAAFCVNDDVDAAIALEADILHIGQDDMTPAEARDRIGPDMILGLSVHSVETARVVDPAIVDYCGAGPVFDTQTKPDAKPATGLVGLDQIIAAAPVPTVAIGGIKSQNAAACLRAGAIGVAVVSAICGQPDPYAAAAQLARITKRTSGKISTALTIAGSDPSGGAGIQADLKTFSAQGVYGMAAMTALTAQNTTGVSGVHLVPPDFVAQQIRDVLADIPPKAIKIGMIATAEIAQAVSDALKTDAPIVLDPVMVAKGGHPLLADDAVAVIRDILVPRATVITPNLPEAAALLGRSMATDKDQMVRQAEALLGLGPKAVVLKGGHLDGLESPDLFLTDDRKCWLNSHRVPTRNTHGTGCTLSSSIAAWLAKGEQINIAAAWAKSFVGGAIAAADSLNIGAGHGPTHHFHDLWDDELTRVHWHKPKDK